MTIDKVSQSGDAIQGRNGTETDADPPPAPNLAAFTQQERSDPLLAKLNTALLTKQFPDALSAAQDIFDKSPSNAFALFAAEAVHWLCPIGEAYPKEVPPLLARAADYGVPDFDYYAGKAYIETAESPEHIAVGKKFYLRAINSQNIEQQVHALIYLGNDAVTGPYKQGQGIAELEYLERAAALGSLLAASKAHFAYMLRIRLDRKFAVGATYWLQKIIDRDQASWDPQLNDPEMTKGLYEIAQETFDAATGFMQDNNTSDFEQALTIMMADIQGKLDREKHL